MAFRNLENTSVVLTQMFINQIVKIPDLVFPISAPALKLGYCFGNRKSFGHFSRSKLLIQNVYVREQQLPYALRRRHSHAMGTTVRSHLAPCGT